MYKRKAICVGLLVFAIATTVHAANDKQPWEWTTEERLKARFDPGEIKERRDAYTRKLGPRANSYDAAGGDNWQPGTITYNIDGARNPELFLPHELFSSLLSTVYPKNEPLRGRNRGYYGPRIEKLGYDLETFWRDLDLLTADYVADMYTSCDGADDATVTACHLNRCRRAYEAREAVYEFFGRTELEILLYTAIAPTSQMAYAGNRPDPAGELLRVDGGCR